MGGKVSFGKRGLRGRVGTGELLLSGDHDMF